ncbi:MAG: thioesterase family protein [Hyphomicrobiaceae bacterium]
MPATDLDGFELVYSMIVGEGSIDDNGHVNVAHYSLFFEDAANEWHPRFGMSLDYKDKHGGAFFVSECHMKYFHEALLGQRLDLYGRISDVSEKAALTDLLILERESGELIAGQEMLFVHVDIDARRPAAMRDPLKSMLAAWVQQQAPRVSPLPYKRRLEFRR